MITRKKKIKNSIKANSIVYKILMLIYYLDSPFENHNYKLPTIYSPSVINNVLLLMMLTYVSVSEKSGFHIFIIFILLSLMFEIIFYLLQRNHGNAIVLARNRIIEIPKYNRIIIAIFIDGVFYYIAYWLTRNYALSH